MLRKVVTGYSLLVNRKVTRPTQTYLLNKAKNHQSAANKYATAPSDRPVRTFEDLDVWKYCSKIRKEIALIAKTFPSEEKFRLADQMIRASRSVTANIAEGFGRYHYQESIQFCRHARGSLYELIDHLYVAKEEGFLSTTDFSRHRDNILMAVRILNGFIRHMSKSSQTTRAKSLTSPITSNE